MKVYIPYSCKMLILSSPTQAWSIESPFMKDISGYVSLIVAQIRHYISLGTLGSQESMRLVNGCEHKNTFLFQN